LLESVWVSEDNLGERSTSSGIMDDVLDNSLNVTISFNVVEASEFSWSSS
jgi:hypothetical protein